MELWQTAEDFRTGLIVSLYPFYGMCSDMFIILICCSGRGEENELHIIIIFYFYLSKRGMMVGK